MPAFDYTEFGHAVRADIGEAHRAAWQRIGSTGSWWTAAERVEIVRVLREARAARAEPPWLRGEASTSDLLPASVVDLVRRIAVDVHSLDRDRVAAHVDELGDAAYAEVAAVCVCATAVDAFGEALGVPLATLPEPAETGTPDRVRPAGVGDIGGYIAMSDPFPGPNVGRGLSLAPQDNATFFGLVSAMYAMADFGELVWADRPLPRPEVELVASRVSAVNECFY